MLRAQKKFHKGHQRRRARHTYFKAQVGTTKTSKRVSTVVGIVPFLPWHCGSIQNNVRANDDRATAELARVFSFYDNGQYQIAINEFPKRTSAGCSPSSTITAAPKAGNIAKFYLAMLITILRLRQGACVF